MSENAAPAEPVVEAPPPAPEAAVAPEGASAPPEVPVVPETPKVDAAQVAKAEQFAKLTRREQEIVRTQQAQKQKEAELAKQADALKQHADLLRLSKEDPLAAAKLLGLDPEDLVKRSAQAQVPEDAGTRALRELEELKKARAKEQEDARAAAEKQRQEQESAALSDYRKQIDTFLVQNAEKYELTATLGAGNLVHDVIAEYVRKTGKFDEHGNMLQPGKLLSFDEAAQHVEAYLEEGSLKKVLSTKKAAAMFGKTVVPPKEPEAPKATPTKTLTNAIGASTVETDPLPPARTEQESFDRALAILEGRAPAR